MFFYIIENEIRFSAVRSRGPGGQNVNKVSSAATLYWDFRSSAGLNSDEKIMVEEKLQSFINREGQFFLRSDEFRDLEPNKRRCREKLLELLRQALHRPKARRPTRPTRASKERKRLAKSRRSEIKGLRKRAEY
ncbi:MAG: aminoacyl-tRNA hydrolase [Bdellovibrio sp.]|nr:MAG: aminoacyl-tRNA hydrolase [Bdellovibrio sp.]